MNYKLMKYLVFTFFLAAGTCVVPGQSGGNFTLGWNTIGGGGTSVSAGDMLSLSGTVGQPVTGLSAADNYSLAAGFWAGAASVFGPPLRISRLGNYVIIYWKSAEGNFALQATDDLTDHAVWADVAQPVFQSGDEYWIAVPANMSHQFFRLSGQEF